MNKGFVSYDLPQNTLDPQQYQYQIQNEMRRINSGLESKPSVKFTNLFFSRTQTKFAKEPNNPNPLANESNCIQSEEIHKKNTSNQKFVSPLCSYYNSSHQFLNKMMMKKTENSQQSNHDYYEKSNNFIRKDSFYSKPSTDTPCTNDNLNFDCFDDTELQIKTGMINNKYNDESSNGKPINSNSNVPIFNNTQFQGYHPQVPGNYFNCFSPSSVNNSTTFQNDFFSTEMFGRKGWICTLCNNFNYETRFKCNRCKNEKAPKAIYPVNFQLPQEQNMNYTANTLLSNNNINSTNYNNNQPMNSMNSQGFIDNLNIISIINNQNGTLYSNIKEQEDDWSFSQINQKNNKKKPKAFSERIGDWVCEHCKNFNFSFRNNCNRCQKSK